jgi:phenylacetate-CoA ligase
LAWPALPGAVAAGLLAVQQQLAESQWWSSSQIRALQLRQARELLAHACRHVPHYRETLLPVLGARGGGEIDAKAWSSLPRLRREDIQGGGSTLHSSELPVGHGKTIEYWTSGSTGRPISFLGSELTRFFWQVLTLRDHIWHRRDLHGKLAVIRTTTEAGERRGWGPATDHIYDTGPCATLNIRTDVARQAEWLAHHDPDYLLSHPSNLLALARSFGERGLAAPRLREVRTFGEVLPPALRQVCLEVWRARVVDVYSAEEAGYIALQCPECESYHVQAENLLVEVLDDDGVECEPGAIGKVVLTTLHNFAMPLIRYEIGDYAEVGPPCACGRGLPVLRRIMGRQRNMLRLPDGRQHWPSFPAEAWLAIAPIRQFQIVQTALDSVEARFVAEGRLQAAQLEQLASMLKKYLDYPLKVTMSQVDEIERKPNSKFEDFVSLLTPSR